MVKSKNSRTLLVSILNNIKNIYKSTKLFNFSTMLMKEKKHFNEFKCYG